VGKLLLAIARSQWDRTTAIVAATLAGLMLLLGYFGVASTSYPAEQVPYIVSGGIGGIMLIGLAATLWLSADMRDEWRKLDELGQQLSAAGFKPDTVPVVEPVAEPVEVLDHKAAAVVRPRQRPTRAAAQEPTT
jgi:hypothetical protein